MDLQQKVNAALENSQQNGYEPAMLTAEQLAIDLTTYDADLEQYPIEDVQVAVRNWLVAHPDNFSSHQYFPGGPWN